MRRLAIKSARRRRERMRIQIPPTPRRLRPALNPLELTAGPWPLNEKWRLQLFRLAAFPVKYPVWEFLHQPALCRSRRHNLAFQSFGHRSYRRHRLSPLRSNYAKSSKKARECNKSADPQRLDDPRIRTVPEQLRPADRKGSARPREQKELV